MQVTFCEVVGIWCLSDGRLGKESQGGSGCVTSVVEITKVIQSLKNSNSVGYDNIKTNIIKANVNIFVKYYQI